MIEVPQHFRAVGNQPERQQSPRPLNYLLMENNEDGTCGLDGLTAGSMDGQLFLFSPNVRHEGLVLAASYGGETQLSSLLFGRL